MNSVSPAAERTHGACQPGDQRVQPRRQHGHKQGQTLRHEADAQHEQKEGREHRHVGPGNHDHVKGSGGAVLLCPDLLQLEGLADQDGLHHAGLVAVAGVELFDAREGGLRAGPSRPFETHCRSVRAERARFPPPPRRSSRCPAAPGSGDNRRLRDCRNCAAGAPSHRVRDSVRSAARAAVSPGLVYKVTCARASRSSSRMKRSRSPDTAGGSTTQPPTITTSRPLASIVGGGNGVCTRESSAPAKNIPSRQQTPASTRDPRHSARQPRMKNAAIAPNDSDSPSGTNR